LTICVWFDIVNTEKKFIVVIYLDGAIKINNRELFPGCSITCVDIAVSEENPGLYRYFSWVKNIKKGITEKEIRSTIEHSCIIPQY